MKNENRKKKMKKDPGTRNSSQGDVKFSLCHLLGEERVQSVLNYSDGERIYFGPHKSLQG